MSLAAICGWTLARTLVLCLLAWPVCRWIERAFNHLSSSRRPWFLAALLAPCCFPELLVGYAFRDIALAEPKWSEVLCGGLLFVRMVPVGAIALLAAPRSAMDAAAIHCRRMAFRSRFGSHNDWVELAWCLWHGPIVRALPALALMSLVAFQEFEMAALLQTMSWTDWFVTHQQLGLDRSELLRQSIWPLLWQMPVLLGVVHWLRTILVGPGHHFATRIESAEGPADRRVLWIGICCVTIAVIVGCLIPVALIGWRTVDGLVLLSRQRSQQWGMAREIIISGAIAVCAGLSAWAVSRRLKRVMAYGLLPGLFGSLLLSLGGVTLFQISWLRPLYDTPIPWVLALTVWLLPRAAILRMWLHALRNDEAIHVAEMLDRSSAVADVRSRPLPTPSHRSVPSSLGNTHKSSLRNLRWHLRDQPQFLATGLLCYWAYCDLPSAYLLAPTGMASGLVRLYNFMHFGRSAALSAEASVFFGLPIACLFLLLILNRRVR